MYILDETAIRPHYFLMIHLTFRMPTPEPTLEPSAVLHRIVFYGGLTSYKGRRAPRTHEPLVPEYYIRHRGRAVAWCSDLVTARRFADALAFWTGTARAGNLNYGSLHQAEEDSKHPEVVSALLACGANITTKAKPLKVRVAEHDQKFEQIAAQLGIALQRINDLEKLNRSVQR